MVDAADENWSLGFSRLAKRTWVEGCWVGRWKTTRWCQHIRWCMLLISTAGNKCKPLYPCHPEDLNILYRSYPAPAGHEEKSFGKTASPSLFETLNANMVDGWEDSSAMSNMSRCSWRKHKEWNHESTPVHIMFVSCSYQNSAAGWSSQFRLRPAKSAWVIHAYMRFRKCLDAQAGWELTVGLIKGEKR